MKRRDRSVTLPWVLAGTDVLREALDRLPDDAFAAPSRLPGWTRAHLVGHLARNAEALKRLTDWARTGVETPMYTDREQRGADIEKSAKAPVPTLRAELVDTADALDAAFAGLDAAAWQAQVRSALGRPIPAAEVPWMRVREVWVHAYDLDAGVELSDFPAQLVDELLDEVTAFASAKPDCPSVLLCPDDRDRQWAIGAGDPLVVRGSAADLMGWLIGRATMDGLPKPPSWL